MPSLLSVPETSAGTRVSPQRLVAVCLAVALGLMFWAWVFPYTGDGDSALHYLDARDLWQNPGNALLPWSRPLFKLILLLPALGGMLAARCAIALVTACVLWQTVRLAEDLRVPHPLLAAPLVLWQPITFALTADTMTEMPMALGMLIALRLWLHERPVASAFVIGLLPAVRPEGFFLGVLWGVLVLVAPRLRSVLIRGAALLAMTLGLLAWGLVSKLLCDDWLYVIHHWNWPPGSYESYGHGPIFHYLMLWPWYCGLPLTVLFLLGIRPSLHRRMALPWALWGLVFGVHTILYWRGWFASCGLVRVLATVAPLTALVSLHGWNALRARFPQRPRALAATLSCLLTGAVLAQYAIHLEHLDCFLVRRCAAYIRQQGLLAPGVRYFAGNRMSVIELGLPPRPDPGFIAEKSAARRQLRALPRGSIGIWDDQQAAHWHGITIDELTREGFTVLHEARLATWGVNFTGRPGFHVMRHAVLRKDNSE